MSCCDSLNDLGVYLRVGMNAGQVEDELYRVWLTLTRHHMTKDDAEGFDQWLADEFASLGLKGPAMPPPPPQTAAEGPHSQ